MRRTVAVLLLATLPLMGCTLAKISGRGPVPLILNAPQQKFTVVEHFSESKRRNFDYTGAFDVAEILSARLKAHPNADAAVNVTVMVSSDVASFFINLFTLGLANSTIFTVEGDLVKMSGNIGSLPAGARMDVADSTGSLSVRVSEFAGDPAMSPYFIQTETGLAMIRR